MFVGVGVGCELLITVDLKSSKISFDKSFEGKKINYDLTAPHWKNKEEYVFVNMGEKGDSIEIMEG